ncbi:MAG: TolC family protein, partial [Armatimonadota bacterium]
MKSSVGATMVLFATMASAQNPRDLVHVAFNSRDIIRSAKLLKQSATRTSDSLGAYPLTRIETAFGSSPDVQGGEDLTLFQPIDIFNKSRFGRATGKAGISQAQANLRQAYIDVQLEVLTAYSNWNNARGLQKNAEDQLALVKRMKEITDRRVELRAIPELQKTRAELEVEKQTQVLNDRKANAEAARVSLVQVIGTDFETFDAHSVIELRPDWIAST